MATVNLRTDGCVSCHVGQTDPHPMPDDPTRPGRFADRIGCTDCHGGVGIVGRPTGSNPGDPKYEDAKRAAHVPAAHKANWPGPGNPPASYTDWIKEPWEYVRFVNPGDLRVASASCGTAGCHGDRDIDGELKSPLDVTDHVKRVKKSMMTHGAMLWGAALYNNGAYPEKTPRFGESYAEDGTPQRIYTVPPPTADEVANKGVLPSLDPLPAFEVGHPSNVLRIFERGQRRPLLIGLPTAGIPGLQIEEEPGRPSNRLSARGLGTLNRVDPVWLNLQRTRLLDPTLNMLGTNDQAGDYRSSGCTACHMIYANDRDPLTVLRQGEGSPAHNQGPFASAGHGGDTQSTDPTIPKGEPGHPIQHLLTNRIPSSQCVVCHMHPGTAVSQTYLGYTWWD
ncbi:MAG: hypothetical protein ACYS22_04240, partial [Planctomycetota bacterium]